MGLPVQALLISIKGLVISNFVINKTILEQQIEYHFNFDIKMVVMDMSSNNPTCLHSFTSEYTI